MSEVHLAGEPREQIPTRSQYGKDAGESEDAQDIGIFGKQRQEEKENEKDDDNDSGWKNKHFILEYGE